MPDIFTEGGFIDLPDSSINDDCTAWYPVFEACLIFAWERGAFVGDETDIENAVLDAQNWLIENDCIDP